MARVCKTRQPRRRSISSTNRGFAVLLYTYLIVSFLLMLATTLLTLSTMDLNASQRSAGQQQAFWAAEGELEASLVQLQGQAPQTLSNGASVAYGSRTLLANKITSVSRLYGTGVANQYRLEATGISSTGTQTPMNKVVSTVINYGSGGTTQFDYAAYADAITADGLTTGSINTNTLLSRLLAAINATSMSNQGGNLATRQSTRQIETEWDDDHGRYASREKSPIEIGSSSQIKGNIFLGTRWDEHSTSVAAFDTASRTAFNGVVGKLHNELRLPPITVPSGVVSLGAVILEKNATRCLTAGSYRANYLVLKKGAELCTVGTVNLYITGSLPENDDNEDDSEPLPTKVWVDKDVLLYGQPSTGRSYGQNPSPRDLRIFVKGEGLVRLSSKGSKAAALVYAPDSTVKLKAGTFAGSIIAKRVKVSKDGSTGSLLVYDQALESQDIAVGGTSGDVQVKLWTSVSP